MNDIQITQCIEERRYIFMFLSYGRLMSLITGDFRITNYPTGALLLHAETDSQRDGILFKFSHPDFTSVGLSCAPEVRTFTFEEKKKVNFELPAWEDLNQKIDGTTFDLDDFNPLERFIHNQEPAGDKDVEFRNQLKAAIEFVLKEYKHE